MNSVIRVRSEGHYKVQTGAVDIDTGAWTAPTRIAADALGVETGEVER